MQHYHTLVTSYMDLADRIAGRVKKNLPRSVSFEDIQSAAYLGLVQAAKKYNDDGETSFKTFASYRIIGAIKDYLRELGWGPRGERKAFESLDKTTSTGDCLADTLEARPENDGGDLFDKFTICLNAIAQQAIKLYYLDGLKMREVAERLSLTESRVSQIVSESKRELNIVWSQRQDELLLEVA